MANSKRALSSVPAEIRAVSDRLGMFLQLSWDLPAG
jgi:hypothetical protein